MLFGALLALGQAPFVAVFAWSLPGAAGVRPWRKRLGVAGVAITWSVAGLVGWVLGSFAEVPLSGSVPLYSDLSILTGSVRWVVFALVQGVVLAGALSLASGALRSRAVLFGLAFLAWVMTSAVGGLLYEWWASLDVAARSNGVNQAIGGALTGAGVAENVAYVLAPHAIFVPILYGVPTGLVFFVVWRVGIRGETR